MKKVLSLLLICLMLIQNTAVFAQAENSKEVLVIDGEVCTFERAFTENLRTITVEENGKIDVISFDPATNSIYLNGKFHSKVDYTSEYEFNNLATYSSRGSWEDIGSHKFKLHFLGTESAAVIGGMIAVAVGAVNIPLAMLVAGVSGIVGVSGYCSFEEHVYMRQTGSRFMYKNVLDMYSDRSWSEYAGTITHYDAN